jgi:hypothetical protein
MALGARLLEPRRAHFGQGGLPGGALGMKLLKERKFVHGQ